MTGKAIGGFCAIVGVFILTLPVPIVVNSFAKENFMRHEIQGGRKFYKKYKKEAYHALEFKPEFQRFAELNLQNVAKKVSKGKKKKYLTKKSSEIQSQYLKNRHLKQILNTTVGFYLGTNGNDRSNLTKKKYLRFNHSISKIYITF